MKALFLGYELPFDLDLKYDVVFPYLDKSFQKVEYEGDLMHGIPENKEIEIIKYIEKINQEYDANLVVELIPVGELDGFLELLKEQRKEGEKI
ncbi:hypothetical protein MXL46_13820 [Heyndrickxia sporothermodurans]|uniref:hypothetical protein n=1 Tax=Heyndrickxia sporothermodurans TaxID=46224 RepID=UPI002DB6D427|nr:hypothetical protein [Heyndrickxia sporothermodurans]MEB6550168.1 hypothetical protein [Heyndrickxia sporothermodurans]